MGSLLKYIIYSFTVVLLAVGCITLFKNHPEVQFAFLMPGMFIIMYALIRDEVFKSNSSTIQAVRAATKEK